MNNYAFFEKYLDDIYKLGFNPVIIGIVREDRELFMGPITVGKTVWVTTFIGKRFRSLDPFGRGESCSIDASLNPAMNSFYDTYIVDFHKGYE